MHLKPRAACVCGDSGTAEKRHPAIGLWHTRAHGGMRRLCTTAFLTEVNGQRRLFQARRDDGINELICPPPLSITTDSRQVSSSDNLTFVDAWRCGTKLHVSWANPYFGLPSVHLSRRASLRSCTFHPRLAMALRASALSAPVTHNCLSCAPASSMTVLAAVMNLAIGSVPT